MKVVLNVPSKLKGAPYPGGARLAALALAALILDGCALSKPQRDYAIATNASDDVVRVTPTGPVDGTFVENGNEADPLAGPAPRRSTTVPTIGDQAPAEIDPAAPPPNFAVGDIDTIVPPLALPAFIDLVFGEMLSVPYSTGPGVAARTEIVQLRSSGAMPADVFFDLVTATLRDYGVEVTAENGVYQVLEESALKARIPRFIRSRARQETPATLRPVIQYVELKAIDSNSMASILNQTFPQQDKLKITPQANGNFIILNGLPEDVNTALSVIYDMDELRFAGTRVQRVTPRFWDVGGLAEELTTILSAEGWQVSLSANNPKPILLLPIVRSNDLLIFTRETDARDRVNYWINELDRPVRKGDEPQIFVYSVRNLDATVLAATANQVLTGISRQTGNPAERAATAAALQAADGLGATALGGLVVDPLGNRLIFSGTPSDYQRLLPLLTQLDVPPAEVLIEVMIAQITLLDSIDFGVDWVIRNLNDDAVGGGNFNTDASTNLNGIISGGRFGPGGVVFDILSRDADVNFNAFAQNNQVNVLSTPRLLARSGASAQVQVGTDVPVLSSQVTDVTSGGGQNINALQTVQYRSTGIILNIEPIVFSDNRIDLTISQEISSTVDSAGSGVPSPTFNNTSVSTLLSLEDGATAVIGGLIQDTVSRDESGVPFLKDMPLVGGLFRSTANSVDRTELVILIRAYVIRGQADRAAFVEKYSSDIDRTLRDSDLVTLRPKGLFDD